MKEQSSFEVRRASPSNHKEAKEQKAGGGLYSSRTTDTGTVEERPIQVPHNTHSVQVLSAVQYTHDNKCESLRTSYLSTALLVCLHY